MHNHRVCFVDDDALPDGTDWCLVQDGDLNIAFIKEGADLALVLCEAWTAFHRKVFLPRPRDEWAALLPPVIPKQISPAQATC